MLRSCRCRAEGIRAIADKVVAAKTVMLVNESGTARFGDDLYRQIRAWNRWQVVTDRGKADLVLVLSPPDTVPMIVSTGSATASGQTVTDQYQSPKCFAWIGDIINLHIVSEAF